MANTRGKVASGSRAPAEPSGALAPDHVPLIRAISEFDAGFLVGILVGEGHFGGDARQPQITLRMHTDHAAVFAWLMEHVPGGRLYGPYDHSGRRYYQWMARGAFLRNELVPLLDRWLAPGHSQRASERYLQMKARYGLGEPPPRADR
jgi:hypothetical protein